VALNAVLGLAYYLRAAAYLFATPAPAAHHRAPWPVIAALGGAALAAVVVGFAPQLVLAAVQQ
jgi:NADH-quinone oxidoreductase subunit N